MWMDESRLSDSRSLLAGDDPGIKA